MVPSVVGTVAPQVCVKYTLLNMPDNVQQPDNNETSLHVLAKPLKELLKDAPSPDEVADNILVMLSDSGLIQYAPKNTLPLLSSAGRVMVCLMENPGSTIREIAVRLGVTEANVGRSVSQLAGAKLIARTKVKNRYLYSFDEKTLAQHPDIRRFYDAICNYLPAPSTEKKV